MIIRTLPNPGKANYTPSDVRLFIGCVLGDLFSVPCDGDLARARRAIGRDLSRHTRGLDESDTTYPAEHVDKVVNEAVELIDGLRLFANTQSQTRTAMACCAIINKLRGPLDVSTVVMPSTLDLLLLLRREQN